MLLDLVGPDGIEPSTSPLSGVRSSHLSYGPSPACQLWWSWSGSNRRPPECKSGALPAELQPLFGLAPLFRKTPPLINQSRPVGYRDQRHKAPSHFQKHSHILQVEIRSGLTNIPEGLSAVYGMERLSPTRSRCTLKRVLLSETPSTVSLRKEVIQPQVLLRLPCYDFTPIMDHTLGRCPPCGSACRLLVQSTFVM